MNNFQRLQEEQELIYDKTGTSQKKSVEGTLSSFKFIANIIEVYLPKVGDLLIGLAGGNKDARKNSNTTTPPNLQNFDSNRKGE